MKTNVKLVAHQTVGQRSPSRRLITTLAVGALVSLASLEVPAQTNGYFLSVSANTDAEGFVLKDPVQPELGYEAGTVVTITAYPYGTNQFLGWTGSTNSSENPLVLVIESDVTLTANFTASTPETPEEPEEPPTPTNTVQIVWQHAHGQLARWFMSDTNFLSAESFGRSAWQAVDAEDMDGDGSADTIFQHDDGRIAIRLLPATNQPSFIIGTVRPSWRIVAVTDFDGDNDNDILFQHANANLAVWIMNGFTRESTISLGRVGGAWRVASVFDHDNDGDQDILFQHSSGRLAAWNMDGTTLLNAVPVTSPQQGWRLAAIEDFDGDGKFDFLFQHSDRRIMVWHMDGLTKLEAKLLKNGRPAAPGWRIVGAD